MNESPYSIVFRTPVLLAIFGAFGRPGDVAQAKLSSDTVTNSAPDTAGRIAT